MANEHARRCRRPLAWAARLLVLAVLGSILWVLVYALFPPPVTATMLVNAADGRGISKEWRSLSDIDPDMARAVIAGEDAKFCTHHGFDREAIEDAWQRYRKGGRIRGGSTISQQTAKNAFLWQGGGFFRKGLEAWFTFLIESLWSKRRIMEVYLNVAETGIGTYGAEAGAQRYFRHGADRMSATEAARIAAVLPLPKKRGAVAPTGFTRRYGNSILARMAVVRREGLDACLDLAGGGEPDKAEARTKVRKRSEAETKAALEAVVPAPEPLPEPEPEASDEPPVEELAPEPAEPEVAPEPEPDPQDPPAEPPGP